MPKQTKCLKICTPQSRHEKKKTSHALHKKKTTFLITLNVHTIYTTYLCFLYSLINITISYKKRFKKELRLSFISKKVMQ